MRAGGQSSHRLIFPLTVCGQCTLNLRLFVLSRLLSSLWVSRTGSASDWCALQEALYKFIDTIQYNTIQFGVLKHNKAQKSHKSQVGEILAPNSNPNPTETNPQKLINKEEDGEEEEQSLKLAIGSQEYEVLATSFSYASMYEGRWPVLSLGLYIHHSRVG